MEMIETRLLPVVVPAAGDLSGFTVELEVTDSEPALSPVDGLPTMLAVRLLAPTLGVESDRG